ncbi:MAG TPA: hypothetical protein VFM30_11345 [Steroidobacteraceae bacterium]|jgi:hypothetical protein|nr:hypothetical protein [Steroidobacteraceae bacterium]
MALRAALICLAILAALPALADERPDEVPAAWTRHEVDLQYMGFTTRYTCGGLRSKVRLLLKHMGVRDDVKILERGCEYGYQKVADFPRLKITFWAPTIPNQGDKDPGEPVLGVWKPVVIKRDSPKGLEMGDCELVEIFYDRVVPLFVTRDVKGGVNCIPHQLVGNRIDLRMDVLTGIKSVDDAKLQRQSLH